MKEWKNRNNEMYMQDWYDNYLIKYVNIIKKPKYNREQHLRYTEKLLEWYENWNGYMEEVPAQNNIQEAQK